MGYRVVVAGATGTIGREVLKTLAERGFPADEVIPLAMGRAAGSQLSYGEDQVLTVRSLDRFDFQGVQLAIFAVTAAEAQQQAPRAAAAGCMVVDLSGRFHLEPDVPLVIPEVNPQALARAAKRRIVASPSGAAVPLLLALKPLHDLARARRVVASTYEAVSGVGKAAMDELWSQSRGIFVNEMPPPEQFPKQIAFNVIPQVDSFQEDGATREEWRLGVEARKILDPDLLLLASCVRVPVFIGHGVAVHAEFENPITEAAAREALRNAPGLVVLDKRDDGGYVTPADCAGEDAVYVSRLRRDPTVPHGLAFWCVTDNLRKGAALNAVQIAELLAERGMLG